jgi:hypothetical protein
MIRVYVLHLEFTGYMDKVSLYDELRASTRLDKPISLYPQVLLLPTQTKHVPHHVCSITQHQLKILSDHRAGILIYYQTFNC